VADVRFEQVHDRIYRVPSLFEGGTITNVYVVRGASQNAVIDTGVLGTPTNDVAPALASLGLTLGDVDLVVNTHGHMDHLGGNAEMKDAGASIALHRADVPRAESNQAHVDQLREYFGAIGLAALSAGREAMTLRLLGREVGVDRVLEDGDVVDLGGDVRLTVVHTPGHTGGSVCYLWEETGILLTGDSIQARGVKRGGLPIVEDPTSYPTSIRKARDVGATSLMMGHDFQGVDGPLGPVATGPRVAEVFRQSLLAHEAITNAYAAALASAPDADGNRLARMAIERADVYLRLDTNTESGFPDGFHRTLATYLHEARASAPPPSEPSSRRRRSDQ
jgi:glyoxylase-like metal-dependent hydrolase (beta-lactamase superfamily II)